MQCALAEKREVWCQTVYVCWKKGRENRGAALYRKLDSNRTITIQVISTLSASSPSRF
jgi:hypothetical protein